jgi:ribonuclease HI
MVKIVEDALLIYTDGSLYPRGRKGGYGIVFVHVDRIGNETVLDTHSPPGVIGTTGNRMELQACIEGLEMALSFACYQSVNHIVIRTDSRYVSTNYKTAIAYWPAAGWVNRDGRPIENVDLWKKLARAFRSVHKRTEIEWVKGHARDPHNTRADKLAKASAKSPLSQRIYRSSVRRKTSPQRTRRGSVQMLGQQLIVRVIEMQWMAAQKTWKYRYEVLSRESPYFESVDLIFSRHQLRDGHTYEVRVNASTANPEIIDVLREVEDLESTPPRP